MSSSPQPKPQPAISTAAASSASSTSAADSANLPPQASSSFSMPDAKSSVEAGARSVHKKSEPKAIQLDIKSGGDHPANSFLGFLDRVAVLSGDATEDHLLRSIWRLQQNCEPRRYTMSRISNPKFIGKKLKGTIRTLKVIERLYQELDQYRHTIVHQMILERGVDACPPLLTKRKDTLAWSNGFLESWFLDQMAGLDRLPFVMSVMLKSCIS